MMDADDLSTRVGIVIICRTPKLDQLTSINYFVQIFCHCVLHHIFTTIFFLQISSWFEIENILREEKSTNETTEGTRFYSTEKI